MKVYKQYLLVFSLLLLVIDTSIAQVGIGTQSPSQKATLDIHSQINGAGVHRGLMLPRVPTSIARDAIPVQVSDKGMMVFVLTTGCLDIYNGSFWEHINCTSTVPPISLSTDVWINEFHYNNNGVDTGEFIEIAGIAGTDLSLYSIVLYNGNNGLVYNTSNLLTILNDDTGTGFGFETVTYPTNGMQNANATPDGMALVDGAGRVLQFLSYGGATFRASNGPAAGFTSTDIGVTQTGSATLNPVGASLQLTGIGSEYADFLWISTTANTANTVNTGQIIN